MTMVKISFLLLFLFFLCQPTVVSYYFRSVLYCYSIMKEKWNCWFATDLSTYRNNANFSFGIFSGTEEHFGRRTPSPASLSKEAKERKQTSTSHSVTDIFARCHLCSRHQLCHQERAADSSTKSWHSCKYMLCKRCALSEEMCNRYLSYWFADYKSNFDCL